ncbi:MAG: hypothetical protein AAGJ93_02890, partial [Bacteroidota bacterium]
MNIAMTINSKRKTVLFKAPFLLFLSVFFTFPLLGQINLILPADIAVCEGQAVNLQPESLSGGDGNYTYQWSPTIGLSDPTIPNPVANPPSSTTYTLTVEDETGTMGSDDITIDVFASPAFVITGNTEICPGSSTTLSVDPPDGVAAYAWSIGATTQTVEVFPFTTTTYSVTVTSFEGCESVTEITVAVNPQLELITSSTDADCGLDNGSITALAGGGVPLYSYLWSTGQTTPNIDFLAPGTYSITVTDANSCTATEDIEIFGTSSTISIDLETVDTPCGTSNGSISATVDGGVAPYIYSWSNGATTASIDNLEAGNYQLTVTDNTGCITTISSQIGGDAPEINPFIPTIINLPCNGNTDGNIDLIVSGGVPPYAYSWSTGATTEDLTGLAAGTYTVTVTGENSCTTVETFTIEEPTLLFVDTNASIVTNASCDGEASGAITVIANGGILPYTYQWSDGQTTSTATNMVAGTYTVWVTDANGCSATADFTITEPNELSIDFNNSTVVDEDCGANNGSIDITVNGGVAPYTYAWSNGENQEDISGLNAGTYTVTVVDNNGCFITAGFLVEQITDLSVDAGADQSFCEGEDVILIATADGGAPAYTYLWNNGATTATTTISPLTTTTYRVTATDANGCTATDEVTVFALLDVDASITSSCEGEDTGVIEIVVSGGTGTYTFDWSDIGIAGNVRTNLYPGIYAVSISDGVCTVERSYQITAEPIPPVIFTTLDNSCFGGGDGAIIIENPQPGFTYTWDLGATTSSVFNLSPGTYCVTVTNSEGCFTAACADVFEPAPINIDVLGIPTEPCQENSPLQAVVTGGSAPYTFFWEADGSLLGNQNFVFVTSFNSIVSLTVTDANGC